MATERHQNIQDPKKLRALAHPLRWKIIDLLTLEGQATATRCAAALDESVASCSYHLNMLAKYGYVEQATGGQGREKPWQMTGSEQSWTIDHRDASPDTVAAGQAASEAFLEYEFTRMKSALRRNTNDPDRWKGGNGYSATVAFVTQDELTEMRAELDAVLQRYRDRVDNPELRPEGHRAVRIFTATTVAEHSKPAED